MARTDALSINIDATTADKLVEIQGFVIEAFAIRHTEVQELRCQT